MTMIKIGSRLLRIVKGDITRCPADAIVNAANSHLAGGGGVDGAIHDAGGSSIMAELDRIRGKGCPTGSAVITGAGELPAKHVIHAVGPRWGTGGEERLLASAYLSSLRLAETVNSKVVTFPSISTGIYGYPVQLAAPVALGTVAEFLRNEAKSLRDVVFVLFDTFTFAAYENALGKVENREN